MEIEFKIGQRIGSTTVIRIERTKITYQCDCGEVMSKKATAQPAYKCKDCAKLEFSASGRGNSVSGLSMREYSSLEELMLKEAYGKKLTKFETKTLLDHRTKIAKKSEKPTK